MPGESELALAHQLIQERRWWDAQNLLTERLQQQPEAIEVRAALARVKLALGEPTAALKLLTPCKDHNPWAGLYWRARVRAATSTHQARPLMRMLAQVKPIPSSNQAHP